MVDYQPQSRPLADKAAARQSNVQASLEGHAPQGNAGLSGLAQRLQTGSGPAAQLRQTANALQAAPITPADNRTGLPLQLRQGVEALSGLSLAGVRVHRNSDKPAQLNAKAYAQGQNIYLGPGQDQHLPHEAWHVVQQMNGRVRPDAAQAAGLPVNSDPALEQEATVMGARAMSMPASDSAAQLAAAPVQRMGQGMEVAPIQMFPPASVEDADSEINQLDQELRGKGIVLFKNYMGRMRDPTPYDGYNQVGLAAFVDGGEPHADPGLSGLSEEEILGKVRELVKLRGWKSKEQSKFGNFGYGGNFSSFAIPQPGLFQKEYGPVPDYPDLMGKPFGWTPPGHSLEQVGDDYIMRGKSSQELSDMRGKSGAYRKPGKVKPLDKPTFSSEIYDGEATILDKDRISLFKQEKRGEEAGIGPFKGQKWPDQQAQLKMSAQSAVASYNKTAAVKLPGNVPYEWLHLFAFSMGGQDGLNPQDPRNFVIGTQYANFYHLIFEKLAKELASSGLNIMVRAQAFNPISEEWRIYKDILYSFSLIKTAPGTFDRPQGFAYTAKTVTRIIPCLEKPQVHASDVDTLRDQILLEFGIVTDSYRKKVETMFPSSSGGGDDDRKIQGEGDS